MSRPISDPVFDIGRDLQRAYDDGYKQGRYDEKVEAETSLPNGKSTHAVRSDTISRADAIEQIQTWAVNLINPKMLSREDAIYILESMPYAQPEIIRCKDCEYWEQNAQHGYDEDNEEYHNYCAKLVPDDDYYAFTREADDFCSRGKRKRRSE